MAGYSGTPLWKKLGIRESSRVALLRAPSTLADHLEPLPEGVSIKESLRGRGAFDVVVLFCTSRRELVKGFGRAQERLEEAGGLWVAWPKQSSSVPTDLKSDVVREWGLSTGLVDNKVCAIDATWSALRFVVRVKNRRSK